MTKKQNNAQAVTVDSAEFYAVLEDAIACRPGDQSHFNKLMIANIDAHTAAAVEKAVAEKQMEIDRLRFELYEATDSLVARLSAPLSQVEVPPLPDLPESIETAEHIILCSVDSPEFLELMGAYAGNPNIDTAWAVLQYADKRMHAIMARRFQIANETDARYHQGRAAGLYAAADYLEKLAVDYLNNHAKTDPDDGSIIWEFGEAGREYYCVLIEEASAIRALNKEEIA